MKGLITLLFLSFSFSAFWISHDIQYEAETSAYGQTVTSDFDGAITIGYEEKLKENDLIIGIGYDIKGAELSGPYDDDSEYTMMNFYAKYPFPLEDNSFLFGAIGYSIPTGDADDAGADSGLSFGFGFNHTSGIGVSYTIHKSGLNQSYGYGGYVYSYNYNVDFNRFSISYTF